MATKPTRKKTDYKSRRLAEQLDNISDRVAARGVFIVRSNDHKQFDLYDYTRDIVIFDNLPNKHIADKICERYNKNKKYQKQKQSKIRNICNQISKHNTDCIFYVNTIENSTDYSTLVPVETRLDCAKGQIKRLIKELLSTI